MANTFPRSSKLWWFFGFGVLLNASLSWTPLDIWQRFWLFPLGLLVQLLWALWPASPARAGEKPSFLKERLPSLKWQWAILILAAAGALRFFHLVSLPQWPVWDDANYSYFAIGLSEHWNWDFLIGHEKTMPLFTWLQALLFKVVEPSLFSMWLYPALLSLATVPLGYRATRFFFPRSFSLIVGLLWAFTFWPLFFGKFCAYLGVLQWVTALLLIMAYGFFRENLKKSPLLGAALLGTTAALSFYSSILFLAPVGALIFLVLLTCRRMGKGMGVQTFVFFFVPLIVMAIPMELGFARNILGGHIASEVAGTNGQAPFLPHLMTTFSYLTAFFFGPIDQSYFAFAPLWGGFFNPLLGALFFVGLKEAFRFRNQPGLRAGVFLVLSILLPVPLFKTLECFRTDLVLPFFFIVIAIGLFTLGSTLSIGRKWLYLPLFLGLSLGLDLYHFYGVFGSWSVVMKPGIRLKSPERYKAFQLLDQVRQEQGPGLIFTDFVSDAYDQSLLVATYPFNAARNPRLDPHQARWAATLIEAHYQAPLASRFPQARFALLNEPSSDVLLVLAVIPISSPEESRIFLDWTALHRPLQDLYGLMPYVVANPDFHHVLGRLFGLYPQAAKDPLLKAWVLERTLDILLVSDDVSGGTWFLGHPAEATRSYPFLDKKFAMMYHRLGLGLVKASNLSQARECFKRASLFDPKYELKKWLALCGGIK